MGLFDNIFKSSSDSEKENGSNKDATTKGTVWIPLKSVEQLDAIEVNSKSKPQLIFKHSTRCGISRMVMKQFEGSYSLSHEEADLYYLDLLNHRDLSNAITQRFQVFHESPQLLVIKNGETIAHASHGAINELRLGEVVR